MTPFNITEYKEKPERLRHLDGSAPIESHLTVNQRYLIARWPGNVGFIVHDLNFERSLHLVHVMILRKEWHENCSTVLACSNLPVTIIGFLSDLHEGRTAIHP